MSYRYQATFSDGSTATRQSDREYTHAARRGSDDRQARGYGDWYTFHGSEAAARKDAKWLLEVVAVTRTGKAR